MNQHRVRCYECYRPAHLCFCESIPQIDNRTEILLLQHMRERFHPFNTARIVRKALQRCQLFVDHNEKLADKLQAMDLSGNTGLLYPGEDGSQLAQLSPADRPQRLVVIDGTWHHAKTLMRDIPRLARLPRYQITPTIPGQYRIRREPNDIALSSLEATVAALRDLEPETQGLDQLIAAFNTMVEAQLAHPKAQYGWRVNTKRSKNQMGIPFAIVNDLENVVVAYGESEPGLAGDKRAPRANEKRKAVYWVAKHLGSGETFRCLIHPESPLPDHFLEHVELPIEAWNEAVAPDVFREQWTGFLANTDTVAVFHSSTLRLLQNMGAAGPNNVILKAVKYADGTRAQTLDKFLNSQGIIVGGSEHPGRAGNRLANAIALVKYLNRLANSAKQES